MPEPLTQTIIKSPNDHRQYQYLTLTNGLSVLLVEDDKSKIAAASMAVKVGHFDDPKTRPGMAHFLEHMLFLGTEKYPNSGEYHKFINQHGGSNNAWTGTEQTNFFYDIHIDAYTDSLDRFSQFFIHPLFSQEWIDKERHAIESEFSLKLKDDIRRVYQVQKETVNPKHPFSKFSVGNLETLAGDPAQLKKELELFYQQHYSANLMTLCLVAPLPMEALTQLAEYYFSDIPNHQLTKHYPITPLYQQEQLCKQINILPLKRQRRLGISFSLPAIDELYKFKPLTFISHLLGFEGKGSLLSYLKSQGLATSLSAGGGAHGYNFKDYNINIQLTEKGCQHIDDIITASFEYIELIKTQGLEHWRYQERSQLLEQAFKYQEPSKPLDLASHLSINMHHYDIEDIIFGDYRMDALPLEATHRLLSLMVPSNLRLQLISQDVDTNTRAKWYHSDYKVNTITSERLSQWQSLNIREVLSLPVINPFIAPDNGPRTQKSHTQIPVIVSQGEGYRIWHRKDDEFNVPKGHLYLSLDSSQAAASPRHAALTRLYVEMLLDFLTEYTYQAEVAGLSYNIYPHQGGITLHLTGFTGKQETLLALIINKARERNFTQARFNIIKQQILRNWYNHEQSKPISQLFTSLTVTLQKRSFEPSRMAAFLEDFTLEDLHEHVRLFYEKVHLEGLVYGDWLISEVHSLAKRINLILSLVSSPSDSSAREIIDLSHQNTLMRELTIYHQDSSIIVYYQSPVTNINTMSTFSLLNHTMSSSFFHELRTQRQLGYMLGTGYLPLNRYPGMIFYIQSPTRSPLQLLEAIDQFIADFTYAIMQITQEEWEKTKQGLIKQLMEQDTNLKSRSQHYWASIANKDYGFNQREKVAEHITHITRAELIKFMVTKMRTKHADRLVLFNTGENHQALPPLTANKMITDLRLFKQQANNLSHD
ncbi:insulinase family protein [Shewanella surugensis]|uniref:Protease 3 n=1 Tax=Shewanella surugensis TaxID=212020 RepID=A0ABT0LDA9_9GAMM|nr:insulinase family protein [Shewanella surugensis]MCL1125669.1 insulinase family protein [Shewanella surugensis]